MNKIAIPLILIVSLVSVWIIIIAFTAGNDCPEQLPVSFYSCESDNDCYFHPKYDCINQQTLDCVIKEDLSARQQAASIFSCECVSDQCVLVINR